MATRYIKSTYQKFYFLNNKNQRKSFKLIFGDEVTTSTAQAPSGSEWQAVSSRGRKGEIKQPDLTKDRSIQVE